MATERFTASDMDDMGSLIGSDGLKALVKYLELKVQDYSRDVLTCDVNNNSFATIGIKKSIYEGANNLLCNLTAELNRLAALDARSKK